VKAFAMAVSDIEVNHFSIRSHHDGKYALKSSELYELAVI